ncbi:hypothetical protein [Streptomyces sp. NBC_01217]|uniref:hypothetical protein n=1 Tax=Streptomyces sp. NBC_01217 TaxID=2903779 RepID=UPI002E11E7EC|nr:hypothetical protein OG507_20770 [Streptomyces sp. NBC_01217]
MTDNLNEANPSQMRLLPWTTAGGDPCYLSPDGRGGVMSRIADEMEAAQLTTATDVLEAAQDTLTNRHADNRELRIALARAAVALSDVLRVAESRGARLPGSDKQLPADENGRDEGPRLPAGAFG